MIVATTHVAKPEQGYTSISKKLNPSLHTQEISLTSFLIFITIYYYYIRIPKYMYEGKIKKLHKLQQKVINFIPIYYLLNQFQPHKQSQNLKLSVIQLVLSLFLANILILLAIMNQSKDQLCPLIFGWIGGRVGLGSGLFLMLTGMVFSYK